MWNSIVLTCVATLFIVSAHLNTASAAGVAQAGKALYDEKCAKCHGRTGDGDGRAGRSLEHKPTAFNDKALMAKESDDRMSKAIRSGGTAIGKSKEMEGFPDLSDQQIADLIAYVKTLAK